MPRHLIAVQTGGEGVGTFPDSTLLPEGYPYIRRLEGFSELHVVHDGLWYRLGSADRTPLTFYGNIPAITTASGTPTDVALSAFPGSTVPVGNAIPQQLATAQNSRSARFREVTLASNQAPSAGTAAFRATRQHFTTGTGAGPVADFAPLAIPTFWNATFPQATSVVDYVPYNQGAYDPANPYGANTLGIGDLIIAHLTLSANFTIAAAATVVVNLYIGGFNN